MSTSIDEQFIEFIVKSLVGKPDAVKIERRIDEKGVLLELTVDPEDLGRVIGKRGATAQSLRTLLRALGTKNDARYNLKIVDNGEPHERRPRDDDDHGSSDPGQDDDGKQDDTKAKAGKAKDDDESELKIEQEAAPEEEAVEEREDEDDHSSLASKTRKELEEMDDLEL